MHLNPISRRSTHLGWHSFIIPSPRPQPIYHITKTQQQVKHNHRKGNNSQCAHNLVLYLQRSATAISHLVTNSTGSQKKRQHYRGIKRTEKFLAYACVTVTFETHHSDSRMKILYIAIALLTGFCATAQSVLPKLSAATHQYLWRMKNEKTQRAYVYPGYVYRHDAAQQLYISTFIKVTDGFSADALQPWA
jgi:hypothetical protein